MPEALNPIDLLKEEMDNDDILIRINAMHRLKTIVTLINDDAFKSQLLPYLQGLLNKEDDEVLLAIAEELGHASYLLPGSCSSLLPILESLCSVEETVVRAATINSLLKISTLMKDSELQGSFIPMVLRLSEGDWFTHRVSAINLFSPIYQRAGHFEEKIKQKFIELSKEESPQIRRAIAGRIGDFAKVVNKQTIIADLIPILKELTLNDREKVRALCLESLESIIKLLTEEENKIHIIPLIVRASKDNSWKIRHGLSKNLTFISEALGKEICEGLLTQIFTTLLKDQEIEAKVEAVSSLSKCINKIPVDKISTLLPQIEIFARDKNPDVKIGTIDVLAHLSKMTGKELSVQKLFPLLIVLVEDKNPDVKISAMKAFVTFSQVIGTDIVPPLLQNAKTLLTESNWRVRAAVYETLMEVTVSFKRTDLFTNSLEPLLLECLKDKVQTIREFGINTIPTLTQIFSNEWIFDNLIPKINKLLNKDNSYLIRITGLHCLKAVSEKLSTDLLAAKILPTLMNSTKDPVPNVKVVVIKILKGLTAHKNSAINTQIKLVLEELGGDEDNDVQYFAFEALQNF